MATPIYQKLYMKHLKRKINNMPKRKVEFFLCDKFDDCESCKNKFEEDICDDCDCGENFEEEDYDEVDRHFKGRV